MSERADIESREGPVARMGERGNGAAAKARWVDGIMGRLDLEQKVGQLMVFGFGGPVIGPHVAALVSKRHVGGLRVAQKFHGGSADGRGLAGDGKGVGSAEWEMPGDDTYSRPGDMNTKRVYCAPAEYAETLNRLRDLALDRKDSVPLHFTYDQEGEGADFLFSQRMFPYPMGLAASGDPSLAYRVAKASGMQARALGANMIHSPVLDVNTNPLNPEIGARAYSDRPGVVAHYAIESLRGYSDAGITCTGKHFPGRGDSAEDAHFGLPIVDLDRDTLMETHVAPYRALIAAGLPAVMAAFTSYPAFAPGGEPAAAARAIVTGLLREELGFRGVVTTDNIQMQGLLLKFELGEAAIRCLEAGCDLLLYRSESPAVFRILDAVLEAVRAGRLAEGRIDESVQRVLGMRWDMGLAKDGGKVDPAKAGEPFDDAFVAETAREAAERSVLLLRNADALLPLRREARVLLIEQAHHFHSFIDTLYSHPGMLWEEMRRLSDRVAVTLVNEKWSEEDRAAALARLDAGGFDCVVATSWYNYRSRASMLPLLEQLRTRGVPIAVVANTPYEAFGVPAWARTAVVSFCPSGRENLRAVAELLYGKLQATARIDARLA